jgi:glycosidase
MDIVLNHTYGPSPLAQLYWDAINNRPAQENPWYNPVQPHAFGFGEDFNHESPDTKYFFNRVVRHWISEYKLDGYRFDFSKGLTQRPSVDDAGFSAYDATRISHIMGYTNAIRAVDPGSIVILEHFTHIQEEKQLADSGLLIWGNQNFTYSGATRASSGNWDFSGGIASVKGLNQNHLVTYMESHDEERLMRIALTQGAQSGGYNIRDTTTALKRMELNAAFFLTLPGPKMIWQFGELGYDYSINHCQDGTINNNCRVDPKPIRWDYLNDARRKSVYTTYSRLNALRFHPWYRDAFQTGTVQHNFSSAFKWLRVNSGDSSRLVVVGNFGTLPVTGSVTFPSAGTWFNFFSNTTFAATGSPQNISLEPGEYRVFVNRNVNNVQVTPVSAITVPESFSASIYPNPSQGDFNLDLDLVQSGRVTIELYTAMGQQAAILYQGFLVRGKHRLPLQYTQGAAGSYYLKIVTKNTSRTLAITLQ